MIKWEWGLEVALLAPEAENYAMTNNRKREYFRIRNPINI